jgi:hypothetical protein
MTLRQGTWKCISCFMQFSLHPEKCAITHKISVVTSYPFRAVLHNPNATGNIPKWTTELAEFELDFVVRHAFKSQVLTDFVADWTPPGGQTFVH